MNCERFNYAATLAEWSGKGEEKRREEDVEIEVEVVLQGSQPVLAMTTPGSTQYCNTPWY